MSIRHVTPILAAALWLLPQISAFGQLICGDRGKMTGHLDKTYQESRSGLGLAVNGAVLELFTAITGTWTILLTRPGGPTCVLGSGEGWETQQAPKTARGEVM